MQTVQKTGISLVQRVAADVLVNCRDKFQQFAKPSIFTGAVFNDKKRKRKKEKKKKKKENERTWNKMTEKRHARGPIGCGRGPRALSSLEDTYVSDAVSPPCPSCSFGGRDVSSCARRSGHSPTSSRPSFTGGPHKTTTLITVLLAAFAATAAVVYREVVDGKESKTECAIVLYTHPLEIEACDRNVLSDSECILHSSILKTEAPVTVDLTTRSAKKFVVETAATVGFGLCSQLFDASYDSPFTALELSVLELWSVRPAKESDCTATF